MFDDCEVVKGVVVGFEVDIEIVVDVLNVFIVD